MRQIGGVALQKIHRLLIREGKELNEDTARGAAGVVGVHQHAQTAGGGYLLALHIVGGKVLGYLAGDKVNAAHIGVAQTDVLDDGEQEDIFSPEYFEKLSDVKMPATKLELLIKMLKKQISEYSKTNQMAAKKFQEMLEETIKIYHERRKHLTLEEAGEAQEHTSEEIIRNATEQALKILKDMNVDRESFRKIGLTFEEKAFYDILMALRDEYNFEYGADKVVDGVSVNDKCKALAKKIKEIIDTKSSFADWLNNQIVRDQLKFDIKVCLIKNGYPPQYSPEVFRKVMEQVENFEENN